MSRGRRARILPHLHIQREKIVPREPSWSAFWLQKPSILRVCVREEGGQRAANMTWTNPPTRGTASLGWLATLLTKILLGCREGLGRIRVCRKGKIEDEFAGGGGGVCGVGEGLFFSDASSFLWSCPGILLNPHPCVRSESYICPFI